MRPTLWPWFFVFTFLSLTRAFASNAFPYLSPKYPADSLAGNREKAEALYSLAKTSSGSLDLNQERLLANQMMGLSTPQNQLALGLANLLYADIHLRSEKYDSAVYYSISALKVFTHLGDSSRILESLAVQSAAHLELDEIYQARVIGEQALQFWNNEHKSNGLVKVYYQIANHYSHIKKYDSAQYYFIKAGEIAESIRDLEMLPKIYNCRGVAYFFMDEFERSIEYYKKGQEICVETNMLDGVGTAMINIGESYSLLNDHSMAEKYLLDGLALLKKAGDRPATREGLKMTMKAYRRQGNHEKALAYYDKYVALNDSLRNESKALQIAEMERQYESEKKEIEIVALKQERNLASLEAENHKNQKIGMAALSVLLIVICGGAIFGYIQVRKAKKEADDRNRLISDINRRLNASQDALLLSNKTKDKFFALIAHDLRGPVTSLSGIGKVLHFNLKRGRIEKAEELISQIDSSAVKVNHLLDNLLKWALSQTGALTYKPVPVGVRSCIEDCLAIFEEMASAKDIAITMTADVDLSVMADYNMLSTVLRNLVSNALKFTPAGGTIEVEALQDEDAVRLSVTDTGPGMPPDLIHKIVRHEPVSSTQGSEGEKGTGLGLVLCREFVQMHGSQLLIESTPDTGTRVLFALPLARELEVVGTAR